MHTSSMNARESEYIEYASVHSVYVHVSVCVFFTHRATVLISVLCAVVVLQSIRVILVYRLTTHRAQQLK